MPVPRIAIVGRPNVGKSSLLNMMAKRKVAIVDPTPGVTRDRVAVLVDLDSPDGSGPVKTAEVTDTGGYGAYTAEGERYNEIGADLQSLTKDIEQQIALAVSGADLILFAVDTQAGITPQDQEIAKMLRQQKLGDRRRGDDVVPVRVVGTKCDGPSWEMHAYELAGLGFGDPMRVSAKTNFFRRDFLDTLWEQLPEPDEDIPSDDLKIAIIGKRNAGKSTLVNALAGEDRVIVSEIAGTTRDAVDVRFEFGGRVVTAIDTAGLRRKKSFQNQVEWWAFDRAKRSIERADVVLLLVDATESISQVDEQLAMLAQKSFKPAIIVVNKWDLASGRMTPTGRPVTLEDYEKYLRKELQGLRFAPIAFMSAKENDNISQTIDLALELHEQAGSRVSTGKLNRFIRSILETRGPSNSLGTMARIFFCAQVSTHPPTIVLVVNDPGLFTPNYQRFLMNRFREELPYDEVPIRLVIRARNRRERDMREDEIQELSEGQLTEMALADMPDDAESYFD